MRILACQVALGSRTEEICIGLDVQVDLEARHGYGLPKVCWKFLLHEQQNH